MHFKTLAAVAALSLSATPVLAQSQGSLAGSSIERVSARADQKSNLEGNTAGIVGVVAALAAGILIYLAVDDGDDDDLPTSP